MKRFLRLLIVAIVVCVVPSASFAADPYAGRWSGYWISDANGHRGPMRAVVRPSASGYDVRFVGRFAGVVPFVYRSHFDVNGTTADGMIFGAERRLPLFGSFRTEATVTPTQFDATFRSKRDSGRFVLTR